MSSVPAPSHSEILLEAAKDTNQSNQAVLRWLLEMANSFDAEEIFEMIAYVDTPDVLG